MAEVHGKGGLIAFTGYTAGAKEWTWKGDAEAVETTDFTDAGQKTYIVGKKGWTATVKANWDAGNTAREGDTVTLTLTAATGKTYSGSAIITSLGAAVSVDAVNSEDYEFQGSGPCTVTLS